MSSSLREHYGHALERMFGSRRGRPFIDYAIERVGEEWEERRAFVIEAPTGYGKSVVTASLALRELSEGFKLIAVFPLRSLLEDQYRKMGGLVEDDLVGRRYMHEAESPFLIRPFTLTTLDTFSLTLFGLPPEELSKIYGKTRLGTSHGSLGHYMFSWASVFLSDVVLDEVQLAADETKSLNFLAALIKLYRDGDRRLFFMSATIPRSLKDILQRVGGEDLCLISFSENPDLDPKFIENRSKKEYDVELLEGDSELIPRLERLVETYNRGVVIFNTVEGAISFYEKLKQESISRKLKERGFEVMLLHGRFNGRDRRALFERMRDLQCKGRRFLLVTTQVIEAGTDISAEFMVTEIAPANSLIQRAGRFLRREEELGGAFVVWYDESGFSGGKYRGVYDEGLVRETLEYLKEHGDELNLHLPVDCDGRRPLGFSELLDKVYGGDAYEVNVKEVENMLTPFLHLEEGSPRAAELFEKMEGSFVRSSLLIPVVPKGILGSLDEFDPEQVIPLSFQKFVSIAPESCKAISREGGGGYKRTTIKKEDVKTPRRALRKIVGENIVAVAIDAEYSPELGLVIGR